MILSGKVARIHEQEARERYWILRRELEISIDDYSYEFGINDWRYENESEKIDKHIRKLESRLERNAKRNSTELKKRYQGEKRLHAHKNAFKRLLNYYKILLKDKKIITRKLFHLNMLWRDMNFVRTRLLREDFKRHERIPYHLDFCRGEASNLAVSDRPEIKSLMNQAAEEISPVGSSNQNGNEKAARTIVSLMIRLNDIRIKRLSEQLYRKNLYMILLVILLVLSLTIWNLDDKLVPEAIGKSDSKTTSMLNEIEQKKIIAHTQAQKNENQRSIFKKYITPAWMTGENFFLKFIDWMVNNPLVFIYMAGLTGGFFSAMMRFKPLQKLPGDELYIRWYRTTKPFIGAFGAMVLYIFVHANLVDANIVSNEIAEKLLKNPANATGFTFGFITGFSERFILPKIIN
ncbi:MAG: hypothetical protein PVI71_13130 [Desulfobacterales bacterium]